MNEDTKMILAEIQKLNARMDSMDAKMDKGFADVRSEMNTLSGRMDSLDAKMDKGFADIRNEMTNIIAEVCDAVSITVKATEDRLSERIDALAAKLDDNQRITKLNTLDIASLRAKQA